MKILKKLLLLFTSIFTLAIISTVSVFYIDAGPIEKPLYIDLQPLSAISFPAKNKDIPAPKSNINDDHFLTIERSLIASYQKATFDYFKEETRYVDLKPINIKRDVEVAAIDLKIAHVEQNILKAHYTKIDKTANAQINNNELVKHYGFQGQTEVAIVSWDQSFNEMNVLAMINNIEEGQTLSEDKVELKVASVEKEELTQNREEEMVFIDYSETDDTNLDQKVDIQELAIASLTDHMDKRQAIPSSVMNVINRETDKRQDISTKATVDMKNMNLAIDAKTVESAPKIAAAQIDKASADEYSPRGSKSQGRNSVNILSIFEANIDGVNTQKELRNFEFNAEVLSTQRLTDDVSGKIRIEESLNGTRSVARGTILKHGYMRTKVDLVLEPGQFRLNLPLLSQSTLGDFLDKESLVARGGFLMVQMPRDANTIEIDRTYEAKIHLNSKFKVVDYEDDYEYVFFVGVAPGNALLTYTNFRGQRAQKITHIVEDEVLFEGGSFNVQQKLNFSLTQRNMLGTQSAPYNVYPDQINFFNTDIESQQEAVASYSLVTPIKPQGTRNYLEVKASRYPLFVGLWNDRKIELPSDSFASYILDSHQLRNLENSCIVQVNLQKAADEVVLFGETEQGQMGILKTYLDRDGQFNYEATEMASHIFLVGDAQGVMSLKVKYTDQTVDILQTFCSNNTYLVEQL